MRLVPYFLCLGLLAPLATTGCALAVADPSVDPGAPEGSSADHTTASVHTASLTQPPRTATTATGSQFGKANNKTPGMAPPSSSGAPLADNPNPSPWTADPHGGGGGGVVGNAD